MKLKTRRDDASALETNDGPETGGWRETSDWREMSDWFAELRDDGAAGRPGDGRAEPAGDGGPGPQTAAGAPAASRPAAGAGVGVRAVMAQRAVIGDQLRAPIAWCEMGSCISRHADPAALGEADIRGRAISAGWRIDALGRLACPRCQQASPGFRAPCPVALWDRDTAITSAARMTAAVRSDGTAGSPATPAARLIPAGQPPAIPRQPAIPATAPQSPWPLPPCLPADRSALPEQRASMPRHRRRDALTGQQPAARPHRAATA